MTDKTQGLWNDEINPQTGEHSLQQHTPKLISTFCKQGDHYFELKSPSSRQLKCRVCNQEGYYILGLQQLVDGKVLPLN